MPRATRPRAALEHDGQSHRENRDFERGANPAPALDTQPEIPPDVRGPHADDELPEAREREEIDDIPHLCSAWKMREPAIGDEDCPADKEN